MEISIKNNISYTEIEKAYKELKKSSNVDLYIPANITGKQLGIYTEIIQLIITWSRLSEGKLYIHYNSDTDELDDKIKLYEKAANEGNSNAQEYMGKVYYDKKDYIKAFEWYEKSYDSS